MSASRRLALVAGVLLVGTLVALSEPAPPAPQPAPEVTATPREPSLPTRTALPPVPAAPTRADDQQALVLEDRIAPLTEAGLADPAAAREAQAATVRTRAAEEMLALAEERGMDTAQLADLLTALDQDRVEP